MWQLSISLKYFPTSQAVTQVEEFLSKIGSRKLLQNSQETTRKRTKVQMLFCTFCKYVFRTAEPKTPVYSEPSQTFKMERFVKTVLLISLNYFRKTFRHRCLAEFRIRLWTATIFYETILNGCFYNFARLRAQ